MQPCETKHVEPLCESKKFRSCISVYTNTLFNVKDFNLALPFCAITKTGIPVPSFPGQLYLMCITASFYTDLSWPDSGSRHNAKDL